jgi:hypothetical protein
MGERADMAIELGHSDKLIKVLQKELGCQGRAAAANSGVRRPRDFSRAARR